MKKPFFLILTIFLLLVAVFFLRPLFLSKPSLKPKEKNLLSVQATKTPTPSPVSTAEQIIDFKIGEVSLRAAWIKVADSKKLSLYPNLQDRVLSGDFREQKKCQNLVSAGFYSKDSKPIGLFVTEGEKISEKVQDRFFDGIFSVDSDGKPRITLQVPGDNLSLALQSGPVLIWERRLQNLTIKNDESARRLLVALTTDNQIYFFVIFEKESVLGGPYLEHLPKVLGALGEKMEVRFSYALNLDGGAASAFYGDSISLPEFAPVGGFFCTFSG